jgi:outer membrane protein TolC
MPVASLALRVVVLASSAFAPTLAAQPAPPAPPADDTVRAAIHTVILQTSPELAARRAAVAAAEARLGTAGRAGPVALSAETEGVPSGVDLTRAQSVRVQAERELVPAGVRAAARSVAQTDVDASRAALRLAEQRLTAVADRTLIALAGWSAVGRRLTDEDSLLGSAEASLRARFAVGDARYVDVLRLRTERLRVQSDRAGAVAESQAARRALEGLAADSGTRLRALAERVVAAGTAQPLFAVMPPAPDVDSLVAASGRVALADARVARAAAERARLVAEQRPRLSGFIGVQRFAGEAGFPIGPVAGATISLPFTARAANEARAAAAARDVVAAGAERRATLASLRATLLAARDRYEAARARVASFDAALLRGARDERESALGAYRSGELSLLELLDFERALARAETERLRNRIDAADALADLLGAGDHGAANDLSLSRRFSSDDR